MERQITVVGLGFVGQPLALSFARRGVRTVGLDVDPALVEGLREGSSKLLEEDEGTPIQEILQSVLERGLFIPTVEPKRAYDGADAVLVAVGIPVVNDEPDLAPLEAAIRTLAQHVKPGCTVILRTTVPPGTTASLLVPALERRGLKVGEDVFAAYVPERLAEGRAFLETRTVPVLIAAPDEASRKRAREVMKIVLDVEPLETESYEAAELSKLVENAQRDVNIALVQEVSRLATAIGASTREVLRLANSHPRVRLMDPGPGVGGFCLPNAFRYMDRAARTRGIEMPTFRAARVTNDMVPKRIVDAGLRELGTEDPRGVRVAVVGLAMKDFSMDDRLSPPLLVADALKERGLDVRAFDPLVKARPYQVPTIDEALEGARILFILARQPGAAAAEDLPVHRMKPGGLIVDTRGLFAGREEEVRTLGLRLWEL